MSRRLDKLLILDLDETLVYVTVFALDRDADFRVGTADAYKRPGLDGFMNFCIEHFEVGIWTSATMEYAGDVIFHLGVDPSRFAFIWTREHCTRGTDSASGESYWCKDINRLSALGYRAEDIIVVDDSPESWTGHHDIVIQVAKYRGDLQDNELDRVRHQLENAGRGIASKG